MFLKWIPLRPGDNPQNRLCTTYSANSIKALRLLTREERLGSLVRLRKTNRMAPSVEITAGGWRGRWMRGHIKVGSPSPDTHAMEDHRSILRPGAIWAAQYLRHCSWRLNSTTLTILKKKKKNLIASVHHFWQGDHGHLGLTILRLTGATDGFISFFVHRLSCSGLTYTEKGCKMSFL